MMNHRSRWQWIGIATLGSLTLTLGFAGCSEEEPAPVVQAAPPPPPPPPAPKVKSISELMAELNIDPRIILPEDKAPATTAARVAVLEFFDAMARGDAQSLEGMLSEADKESLKIMVESGSWAATTADIQAIEVQTGASPSDDAAALAVITVGTDYQPQLWYYAQGGEGFTFDAVATPPGILDKLSGGDWIQAWHDILAADLALADLPDEEITVPKTKDSGKSASEEEEEAPASGGSRPGGGSGRGKNKDPGRRYQRPGP
jgi:hypothetical protein